MRVIAGSARRLLLKTPSGTHTRPTTDRIKETLFNILQPLIPGCSFLDLFAGSGGIGIEALSRGAGSAVFVENNREALLCIRENLEHTRFTDRAKVLSCDVLAAIGRLGAGKEQFDVIFLDPPYDEQIGFDALMQISAQGLASPDTLIVLEESLSCKLPEAVLEKFTVERMKDYKTNRHFFLRIN